MTNSNYISSNVYNSVGFDSKMCYHGWLYKNSAQFVPIDNKDNASLYLTILMNIIALIFWLHVLWSTLYFIPKCILDTIRYFERKKVLRQLVKTDAHERNEKVMDMCSSWIAGKSEGFDTDECMAYLERKSRVMEDAGMFGDDGKVLHKDSWGHLERDPLIRGILYEARHSERHRIKWRKTDDKQVPLYGDRMWSCERLEEWKKTRSPAKEQEEGMVSVDQDGKDLLVSIEFEQ